MKKIPLILLFSVSFLMLNAQTPSIKKFSFLIGDWELITKEGKVTEHWKTGSTAFTGSSYKHKGNGDSILTETIILKKIHGHWYYCVTGYEKGNTGTTNFGLISTRKNTFIFENAEHDFPQRIGYQPQGKDKMFAWIEGKMNGKDIKIEFPYLRKK